MKKVKVTIFYPANKITRPIIYHLVKDYDLIVNILHADISINKLGKTTLDIEGEEEGIEAGLEFIKQEGLEYKLFTKSIIWQEENCIHCGACTAVCPSGALQMDRNDWSLTFDKEKCVACEVCIKACPIKVMCVGF